MRIVVASRSTKPRLVIISQTYSPAPCSLQSLRYAALVIPAIGASATGATRSRAPRRNGPGRTSAVVTAPLSGRRPAPRNRDDADGARLRARAGSPTESPGVERRPPRQVETGTTP